MGLAGIIVVYTLRTQKHLSLSDFIEMTRFYGQRTHPPKVADIGANQWPVGYPSFRVGCMYRMPFHENVRLHSEIMKKTSFHDDFRDRVPPRRVTFDYAGNQGALFLGY